MNFFLILFAKKNQQKSKNRKKQIIFLSKHIENVNEQKIITDLHTRLYCTSTDLLAQCDDDVIVDKNSFFFVFCKTKILEK